ncbi:MAG: ABC transporter ATP-binding protein [Alphaproteobacteria bacterium]
MSVFKFILQSLMPFKWKLLGTAFICVVWATDLSLTPYIIKTIIDRIQFLAPHQAYEALFWPAIAYVALRTTVVFGFRVYEYIGIYIYPPLKRHLGKILMERMMQHSHQMYQNQFAGSLGNKMKDVISGVPDLVECIIDRFFAYGMAMLIAIGTLWTVNVKFALLLTVWIVVSLIVTLLFGWAGSKFNKAASEQSSKVVGTIVDTISNMMNVRLFAAIPQERKILNHELNHSVKAEQLRNGWFLKMFIVLGISFVTYEGSTLFLLVKGFKEGHITAGDFALILSIGMSIAHCLWDTNKAIYISTKYYGQISQGLNVVLLPIDIQDKPGTEQLTITRGEIVFDKVKFQYDDTQELFQDNSVIIKGGEKVGLVGYSGSGKSTFVNLILRLFDVKNGCILIDGQDIQEVTQDSLHEAIGMIPQDPVLFHRSLLENIRYGKLMASDAEVMQAAKRGHAHDFIENLPQKYEALVGERGVKLSGGQRQRIAIARAILKNAPILILDEATSQLDSVTEIDIQDSLWELMQGKTTIVIAHRLSTLLKMDRLMVFDQGKIVESGTHKELLAKKGMYKALWDAQVGGFLPDNID